ncbi:MAG: UDP-N-acetylmuramoyl-tripeptide--D-alanyl-D-alanine ligase [bacterium]
MRDFRITVGELATAAGAEVLRGDPDTLVLSFDIDSRTIQPGALFFALRGARADGHDFVAAAEERGASGAVVRSGFEPPTGLPAHFCLIAAGDVQHAMEEMASHIRRKSAVVLVGITGSVGKTTAKEILAHVICERFSTLHSKANWNTEIGVPLTLSRITGETEVVVQEMAMRGRGQIARLSEIARPDHAVITNARSVHIELLGTKDEILKAKLEITKGLGADGSLWLNRDEAAWTWLDDVSAREAAHKRIGFSGEVRTFGMDERADVSATGAELLGLSGSEFKLNFPDETALVRFPLLGNGAIASAISVAGVAWKLGLSARDVADRLETLKHTPGRLNPVERPFGTVIDDAYNAGPDSVLNAIGLLRSVQVTDNRPVIAVIGDMLELGAQAEIEHHRIGRSLSALEPYRAIVAGDYAATIEQGTGDHEPWLVPVPTHNRGRYDEAFIARVLAETRRAIKSCPEPPVVLVKASRSVGLDRVVAELVNRDVIPAGRCGNG